MVNYSRNDIHNYNINYLAAHAKEVLIKGDDGKLKTLKSANIFVKMDYWFCSQETYKKKQGIPSMHP